MNPQGNPLDQLKDIHLPQEVGLWPLAWGWWLLIVVIVMAVIAGVIYLVKRHRKHQAKRQTVKALVALSESSEHWPQQINSLLKRVAMVYFPTGSVEQLHSSNWVNFLLSQLPANKRERANAGFTQLQSALYQRQLEEAKFEESQRLAIEWVKHALPPSGKQIQGVDHV